MQTAADGVSSAQTHLNNAQASLKQTEAAITSCKKALRGLNWTKAGAGLSVFSKQATEAGDKLSKVDKAMTQYATLPIAALGATAVKSANSFESAFAGVRKTVNATEVEYAELSRGIEALSTKIPASADLLTELMEAAVQLGIRKDALMSFTRVMTDMGSATNLAGVEGARRWRSSPTSRP